MAPASVGQIPVPHGRKQVARRRSTISGWRARYYRRLIIKVRARAMLALLPCWALRDTISTRMGRRSVSEKADAAGEPPALRGKPTKARATRSAPPVLDLAGLRLQCRSWSEKLPAEAADRHWPAPAQSSDQPLGRRLPLPSAKQWQQRRRQVATSEAHHGPHRQSVLGTEGAIGGVEVCQHGVIGRG